MHPSTLSEGRRPESKGARSSAALIIAFALWLPALHLFFRPDPHELIAPLAKGQLRDVGLLRANNPEWDLMARTFTVLSLANLGELKELDRVVNETEALERSRGPTYFMLPYGKGATQSLFVDGEVGLMLATRQLLIPSANPEALRAHVARIEAQFARSIFPESYPDEGWVFCNTVALATLKVSDAALKTDHSALLQRWTAEAKARLVDPKTGLLVSSFHSDGRWRDGPEGSTLWLAAHMLQLVDEKFAAEQYALARAQLGHQALGFGWAGEWPSAWPGHDDVDSGPTIPLVDANAGSSGLALVGAAAFGDAEWHRALLTSLHFAAFPTEHDGQLSYAAGNSLADAVLLYSLVQGPLWSCVKEGERPRISATPQAAREGAASPTSNGGRSTCSVPRS